MVHLDSDDGSRIEDLVDSDLPCWADGLSGHDGDGDERDPKTYTCSGKPTIRVGEAKNPGPRSSRQGPMTTQGAAVYRQPHRPGFHGALLHGECNKSAEVEDSFALTIDTVNGTSWGSLNRYLRVSPAHVVLAQEHHLGPDAVAQASAWALRRGWRSIIAPALKGEGNGWRAGVAIFARTPLGLSMPRVGPHVLIPGRAVAALVEAPGYRPCTFVSLYLEDGQGLSAANFAHLEAVGRCISAQGQGSSFVVGGDLQMDPSKIAAAGFAARTGAVLVASRDPRGTCRSSRAVSELDYFFVQEDLAKGISNVHAVNKDPSHVLMYLFALRSIPSWSRRGRLPSGTHPSCPRSGSTAPSCAHPIGRTSPRTPVNYSTEPDGMISVSVRTSGGPTPRPTSRGRTWLRRKSLTPFSSTSQ